MKTYKNIVQPPPKKINTELKRIAHELHSKTISLDRYCQLYAMQQALTWVMNPNIAMSPYKTAMTGKIIPLTAGIPAS